MVGTFYKASTPDSPPFVKIGDMIEPGKTVCIIEAMKIMNEIKSEIKGTVKEIVVENAQAVEFNQPLIIVEKN
jgi:acetyl-CoA carboxylase biotin carboxyl carrier protein